MFSVQHTPGCVWVYPNACICELFMCTQTQINQAKDEFPASTKTPKLMLSLSDCSQARCTAPACSWIQKYLQSLHLKNMLWAIYTKPIKHNHALKTSSSTKCIFCSIPAAWIWSVYPTTHTIPRKEHNPEGQPSYKSQASDPFPGIWTGTLPCRSRAQTGCTAVPTQPTKKSSLCMTGTTTNHCLNSSQHNFKFYLNSRPASLPYINSTLYDATISPLLREHLYFRITHQCV